MELVRLILDASPDRSRSMSTACAANTGVSCSATPGCAANGGDEGDLDPYASGRGDASRDDVLLDGDSSSSSSVALSTEIVSSRTAPVDVARGGPARDADARVSPGRVPTPPQRASTRSRPHAARPRLERRACRTLPRAFSWARPTTIASAHGRANAGSTFGDRCVRSSDDAFVKRLRRNRRSAAKGRRSARRRCTTAPRSLGPLDVAPARSTTSAKENKKKQSPNVPPRRASGSWRRSATNVSFTTPWPMRDCWMTFEKWCVSRTAYDCAGATSRWSEKRVRAAQDGGADWGRERRRLFIVRFFR